MFRLIMLLLALLAAPARAVELDPTGWAQLVAAAQHGFALADVRDKSRFRRADHWEIADAQGGDCEDKALLARAALVAQGWPQASLRIALVWTEAREYHAVLTVDVVRHGAAATYVIDNRFPWVLGWDALSQHGYRWDRRQAGRGWTRIGN
ncbi:transglutaminase-like cysteine peptidase [Sandarakinorhabdus sp.]|uniref:transglutaminase-like cysteine peptidase n=1 Tax=Sandarakinorhabdus sp. TaxID=1916663 RepID=UPI00286DEA76|nr:transglutaminase-like cysteine peptidase [Sandarakinorhabdus sp.]